MFRARNRIGEGSDQGVGSARPIWTDGARLALWRSDPHNHRAPGAVTAARRLITAGERAGCGGLDLRGTLSPTGHPATTKALEAELRIRGWFDDETVELRALQDLILAATANATPGLRELAREANVSVHTLSSWRRGIRLPPPDAVEVLAAVFHDRGEALARYARRLQQGLQPLHRVMSSSAPTHGWS